MNKIKLSFLLCLLLLVGQAAWSQQRVGYELSCYSSQSGGEYDHILNNTETFSLNWSAVKLDYTFNASPFTGKIEVLLSRDSIKGVDDVVLLDSAWSFEVLSYKEFNMRHNSEPGEYYLLTTFYADDTSYYQSQSNTVVRSVLIYGFETTIEDIWITQVSISEYSNQTVLYLDVNNDLSCCPEVLGELNVVYEVFLSEDEYLSDSDESLNSFYLSDTLITGSNRRSYKADIYSSFDFENYSYLIVNMTSSYFSSHYKKIPDQVRSRPLRIINNIEEVNKSQQEAYPFLTYGSFKIPSDTLDSLEIGALYEEVKALYNLCTRSLEAAKDREYSLALGLVDSAFAWMGNHRYSSLIYAESGMIAELYSGLLHSADENEEDLHREISFRLGEAMKMSDLMQQAYDTLVKELIPDTLSLANDLEKSGIYDHKANFNQPALLNAPVVWKDYSLPALQHFVRVQDYEAADLMIRNIKKHMALQEPLWKVLASSEDLKKTFSGLATEIIEYNDMFDLTLAMLDFYTATGSYEKGWEIQKLAMQLFNSAGEVYPVSFWQSSAVFFESIRAWNKADSTYLLIDQYYAEKSTKQEVKNALTAASHWLKMQQSGLLSAKRGVGDFKEVAQSFDKHLKNIKEDDKGLFLYMDIVSDRRISQMAGFFGSSYYPALYVNNIESLDAQHQYFLSGEWKKELAFFLGRDDRYNEALSTYFGLFTIENMKSQAFRLSFSEESQITYFQQQQETLSRYINLLYELQKQKHLAGEYNKAVDVGLQQALFYHSFILRGNFRVLYDIYQSDDPEVQMLYTKWQALREYLNELYVKQESNEEDMTLLKREISSTEDKLIRASRDTSSFYFDHLSDVADIRERLNDGEAAVELIRYKVNHQVYYGNEVKYAAFIIRKDSSAIQLVHFDDGESLESRSYLFYRNAIQYKQQDTLSYAAFWKPLADHLVGIKKVYWAPDGIFHLVNPATFYNNRSGQYLLEELDLEVVPTISDLPSDEILEIGSALLLGNPQYIKDATYSDVQSDSETRSAFNQQRIADLPGTKTEVNIIASLLRKKESKVEVLTEKMATKNNIFKSNQADVLHFATHGFWLDQQKRSGYNNLYETLSGSGLILANAQAVDNDHNRYSLLPKGILTAAEIQDMYLFKSKLVVLSACETGLGEVVAGEGLYGLKRAFQRAGTENIITSLWKVDDEVTQIFMVDFYQRLISTGNLSVSFKETMIAVKEKYPEPYYWGAFVLTSNR